MCDIYDILHTFYELVFTAMEISCGEYGDRVPDLVVAAKSGQCSHFQILHKSTNCLGDEWPPRDAVNGQPHGKASSDYCSVSFVADLPTKETAILDDSDNDDGFCASSLTVPCSNSRSSDDNSSSTVENVCVRDYIMV